MGESFPPARGPFVGSLPNGKRWPSIDFKVKDIRGAKIWISVPFDDASLLEALADPDRFFADPACQIIKDQKKIKVGRLTLTVAGMPRTLYVKRYNSFSLRFRLLSPFFRSGALRALRGAEVLRRGEIPIAEPAAAVEKRRYGMLSSSFFITEEIAGGKTANAYWVESFREPVDCGAFRRRRAGLRQLASLFGALHSRKIYHNDLKEANILMKDSADGSSAECFLLDLEGVRQCRRMSERRRIKNLVQLYRSFGRLLSRSQQSYFLKSYLGPLFEDRKHKRGLIARVLESAKRVDRSKGQVVD